MKRSPATDSFPEKMPRLYSSVIEDDDDTSFGNKLENCCFSYRLLEEGLQSLRGDPEQTQVPEDGCCQEESGLTNISGAQPSSGSQVAFPIAS